MAYADFVTAMMALFLVLWLMSQDSKIKEVVERSFRNPFASVTKESTGVLPGKDVQSIRNMAPTGSSQAASVVELNILRKLSEDIIRSLQPKTESPEDESIKLELTPEGIRISVFDRVKRPIFESDTARFTSYGSWVFSTLAWQVSYYTNVFRVELEGHTQSGYASKGPDIGVWELSTERANAARRKMVEHGLDGSQIRKVAGFADTMPLADCLATDERNRRVTLLLKIRTGTHLD